MSTDRMGILSPASRSSFSLRLSVFDTAWALITPPLALWVRDAPVLSASDWPVALIYCALSFAAAVLGFLMFRVRDGMTPLFAVHDAIGVAKAVLVAEFVTCLVLFTATRLDGVPRTTPLIHALLLAAGMIIARAYWRMRSVEASPMAPVAATGLEDAEHIVFIGSNRLSSLYIECLNTCAPGRHRVIAILDDDPDMAGRSIGGVRVLGPTIDLLPVIEEFREHGIKTDRIIVGANRNFLGTDAGADIRDFCAETGVRLDFVPELLGLRGLAPEAPRPAAVAAVPVSSYFRIKRLIDLALVSLLLMLLLPVFMLVSAIVLLDVGSPILFWQRRVGMHGRAFQIHKFRTMKPAFNWRGTPIGSTDRMSWIGSALRKLRLDELPQLLNVLVGDMSLIGPRPLLPQDQPPDTALRLSVRPGITGLAQVCGGTLLSAPEKAEFDAWYVRHASLPLDLKILARTVLVVISGERRGPRPLDAASDADARIGARTVHGA